MRSFSSFESYRFFPILILTLWSIGPQSANGNSQPMLTISGGQLSAERVIWQGSSPGNTGGLLMTSGIVQVQSSSENVAAGSSAASGSGSINLLANSPGLTLQGDAVKVTDRLSIVPGGTVSLDGSALLEVTRSSIETSPGSGVISANHPSLDFSAQFISGQWTQVLGTIDFATAGNGQPGNGALLRVLGQSEVLSTGGGSVNINFVDLLTAAIANGKLTTSLEGATFNVVWDGTHTKVWVSVNLGNVEAAYVYYPGWNGPLGDAIDSSKQVARQTASPQVLSYANLINTSQGITGIVFDIEHLGDPESLSASDFVFQVSPLGTFSQALSPAPNWALGPQPSSVSVLPGSPARVLIQWPDNAIANRWLRVTVLATPATDLPTPEVFFIGHMLGETNGQVLGDAFFITFEDILAIRQGVGNVVDSSSPIDIDKNSVVQFSDITAMRPNVGAGLSNITIP